MSVSFSIISIGTLSHHRLWGETSPVRTAHATTTLVVDEDRRILVDPSLPATALNARFFERTGKQLDWVTDVFCTTLRPVHRRSLEALTGARWWASETEVRWYRGQLGSLRESAQRLEDDEAEALASEEKMLSRIEPAPDKFTAQVGLFPLAGASPGSAGMILTPSTQTVLIAGDAVLTREHFEAGQVWLGCENTDAAMESFREVMELADIVVPGHDNLVLSPQRWL